MKKHLILSIFVVSLIFLKTTSSLQVEEDDEDLSFLEEDDHSSHSDSNPYNHQHDYENYDDLQEDDDLLIQIQTHTFRC